MTIIKYTLMKEEIDLNDEFELKIIPNPMRSQSMHITSVNIFNAVPTIHPKGNLEWPSPMQLVKPMMSEIKEDELAETEEEKTNEYNKGKLTSGKSTSNNNVINFSICRLNSNSTPFNTIKLSPIKQIVASPLKRRSSILLSLENKRKNTMS